MPHSEKDIIRNGLESLFLDRKEFAHQFYERFFLNQPEAKQLFTNDLSKQEMMLYAVVTMVVSCLRSGKDIAGELAQFGRIHARAGVDADHFSTFGQAFLDTMIEFLPDRDPHRLAAAWVPIWEEVSEAVIAGIRAEHDESRASTRVFHPQPRDDFTGD